MMSTSVQPYHRFAPRTYLDEYYQVVPTDTWAFLAFLVREIADVKPNALALDFGSGPTLYTALALAPVVGEIHLAEYVADNRQEVLTWLQQYPGAFDWSGFTQAVLALEGQPCLTSAVRNREALVRRRVTQVVACDATRSKPLGDWPHQYDLLVTNLCLEAAATTRDEWLNCVAHVASLLKPGGRLLMSAVRNCEAYPVGEHLFPVVSIDEDDLVMALSQAGFLKESLVIEKVPSNHPDHPYEGLLLVSARLATADLERERGV
jgi:SAM-dependent methyltransferase